MLTMLGLLFPLGAIGIPASTAMAIGTVQWGKPIWADQGGGELPLTNATVATALILAGSGRYSLDRALGLDLPDWVTLASPGPRGNTRSGRAAKGPFANFRSFSNATTPRNRGRPSQACVTNILTLPAAWT
jgi:hypothetical protein